MDISVVQYFAEIGEENSFTELYLLSHQFGKTPDI